MWPRPWFKVTELRKSKTFCANHPSKFVLSYPSHNLAGSFRTTVDLATSFLHSSRFSAFRSSIFHSRPVHSLMLSSYRFLCLPLHLPPWTVLCRIVLASNRIIKILMLVAERKKKKKSKWSCDVFQFAFFTDVRRSSYGPMAFPVLAFTSSLVMRSLYAIPRSFRKHLISNACILSLSAVRVHVSHAYKNMDMARERISLVLELMAMFLSFQMTLAVVGFVSNMTAEKSRNYGEYGCLNLCSRCFISALILSPKKVTSKAGEVGSVDLQLLQMQEWGDFPVFSIIMITLIISILSGCCWLGFSHGGRGILYD